MSRYRNTYIKTLAEGLQERDVKLLKWEAKYRYLSANSIRKLLFRDVSVHARDRRLHILAGRGLLRSVRITDPGISRHQTYWRPTTLALRVLAWRDPSLPILYETESELIATPPYIRHIALVAELAVELEVRREADPRVPAYETLVGRAARLRIHKGTYRETTVSPDQVVVFGNSQLSFMCEFDRGTESYKAIRQKVERYQLLLVRRYSFDELPAWADPRRTAIMVVCENPSRLRKILKEFHKADLGSEDSPHAPRVLGCSNVNEAVTMIVNLAQQAHSDTGTPAALAPAIVFSQSAAGQQAPVPPSDLPTTTRSAGLAARPTSPAASRKVRAGAPKPSGQVGASQLQLDSAPTISDSEVIEAFNKAWPLYHASRNPRGHIDKDIVGRIGSDFWSLWHQFIAHQRTKGVKRNTEELVEDFARTYLRPV